MMTRKDYVLLAETINRVQSHMRNPSERAWVRLAFHEMLGENYDNYDALKFFEALDKDTE